MLLRMKEINTAASTTTLSLEPVSEEERTERFLHERPAAKATCR